MQQQTMSTRSAQAKINVQAERYIHLLMEGEWTLEYAHHVLTHIDENHLDLFEVAGLAKAIACFQCVGA
jgi:hypothetical protein